MTEEEKKLYELVAKYSNKTEEEIKNNLKTKDIDINVGVFTK